MRLSGDSYYRAKIPASEGLYVIDSRSKTVTRRFDTPSGASGDIPHRRSVQLDLAGLPVFRTPEWVKDAVFYQIFPERFANGDNK